MSIRFIDSPTSNSLNQFHRKDDAMKNLEADYDVNSYRTSY
jgi:hypothetical protein